MTPESPADEVLIVEEQVVREPTAADRGPSRLRIAGAAALGSVGMSLAATVLARRLTARRRGVRAQRRRSLFNMQPRVLVFAPSMTISLPFSGIVEERRGGQRLAQQRRATMRRRRPIQQRRAIARRSPRARRAAMLRRAAPLLLAGVLARRQRTAKAAARH